MKQVLQSFKNGETILAETPSPNFNSVQALIQTNISLISYGTEKSLIEFGKSNYLSKIKSQPDKVKLVLDKIKSDGILETYISVNSKLDKPIPLGYCNVGKVISVGDDVSSLKPGDRVVSNGPHAEVIAINENLVAKIPDEVTDDEAVFTVLASIGLQGIRLSNPTFGETFLVSGLGLIGLLTAQLLKAQGCKVLGIDPDHEKCNLAGEFGIETLCLSENSDPYQFCNLHSAGRGVDGVIITASTSSNDPIELAAKVSRKRGRIILVGVVGLELRRDLFYEKELTFQVSCSYGPGRYDDNYEKSNIDYPIAFVRWTEKRNFEAVLEALKSNLLKTKSLVSKRFPIENALDAYKYLESTKASFGILLTYPRKANFREKNITFFQHNSKVERNGSLPKISVVGIGNYSSRTLIPNIKKLNYSIETLFSWSGSNLPYFAKKFNVNHISTDFEDSFLNSNCNTVFIATKHDSHAELVIKSLMAGKNVFIEKPLCLTIKELNQIKNSLEIISSNSQILNQPILMVGYNRRFSNLVIKLKEYTKKINGPKSFIYTCNAGFIPKSHWIHDKNVGGGRLIGEACHFVDLLRDIAGSKILDIQIFKMKSEEDLEDTFTLQLTFMDGSIGTIHYFSNGSKSFSKERLEVFGDGKIILIDNFKKFKTWGFKKDCSISLIKQDKGQKNCISNFLKAIKNGNESPISTHELFEVQEWMIKLNK